MKDIFHDVFMFHGVSLICAISLTEKSMSPKGTQLTKNYYSVVSKARFY